MNIKLTTWLLLSLVVIGVKEIDAQPVGTSPIVKVVKQHLGSVATVVTLDRSSQPQALGSGFFIDSNGSLVTNAHVIEGASSVVIRWRSQTKQAARVIRYDSRFDLAVLATGYSNTPFIPLGDSDAALIGEEIVALGNPQGLEGTVSTGIISGIREIAPERFLQITAPISPGSSGGPILNTDGKVIGIATASLSAGQNLNFAVPVNVVKSLSHVDLRFATVKAPSSKAPDTSTWKDLVRPTNIEQDLAGCSLGHITFSIQNDSSRAIKELKLLLVARNAAGQPLDYTFKDLTKYGRFSIQEYLVIPPGLAKQVEISFLVSGFVENCSDRNNSRQGSVEIRILDFGVVRESSLDTLFKGR